MVYVWLVFCRKVGVGMRVNVATGTVVADGVVVYLSLLVVPPSGRLPVVEA